VSSRINLGPKPPLGYSQSALDRAGEGRRDRAALTTLAADALAGAYVVAAEFVVLRKDGAALDPLFAPGAAHRLAPTTELVFLGLSNGAGRFGIGLDPAALDALKARDDLLIIDLRTLAVQGLIGTDHLAALAEAKSLLSWHARHRYCANCGAATQSVQGGWQRDCPSCATHHFPRTDPVVIMLAVAGERCVLGRQARFAPGMWSCLAGFVEPGETIEQCLEREVMEETGIRVRNARYFASQPWPFPHSLMIAFFAEYESGELRADGVEIEDVNWFQVCNLPKLPARISIARQLIDAAVAEMM